jgi:hypothetical protein
MSGYVLITVAGLTLSERFVGNPEVGSSTRTLCRPTRGVVSGVVRWRECGETDRVKHHEAKHKYSDCGTAMVGIRVFAAFKAGGKMMAKGSVFSRSVRLTI